LDTDTEVMLERVVVGNQLETKSKYQVLNVGLLVLHDRQDQAFSIPTMHVEFNKKTGEIDPCG